MNPSNEMEPENQETMGQKEDGGLQESRPKFKPFDFERTAKSLRSMTEAVGRIQANLLMNSDTKELILDGYEDFANLGSALSDVYGGLLRVNLALKSINSDREKRE